MGIGVTGRNALKSQPAINGRMITSAGNRVNVKSAKPITIAGSSRIVATVASTIFALVRRFAFGAFGSVQRHKRLPHVRATHPMTTASHTPDADALAANAATMARTAETMAIGSVSRRVHPAYQDACRDSAANERDRFDPGGPPEMVHE